MACLKKKRIMKLPLISCKCKQFFLFDLISFWMNGVLFIFILRWHWWNDTSVREAVLLYFADTSSICYKLILLKNVSVMHTRLLPSLLLADDYQRERIQKYSALLWMVFICLFMCRLYFPPSTKNIACKYCGYVCS